MRALRRQKLLLAISGGADGAPAYLDSVWLLGTAMDPASTAGALATLLVLSMSFAAGYVCAAVGRVYSLIGPTVVATASVSLELFLGLGAQSTGLWMGLSTLTFMLTLAGGFAWVRQESRGLALE